MSYMHSSTPHSSYIPCPSHPQRVHHSNYIWRRVLVMKLLMMLFCFLSLVTSSLFWPKYSPQHPVLKKRQSKFLPYFQRLSFTPIQNRWQRYIFDVLIFKFLDIRLEDERFWTEQQQALPQLQSPLSFLPTT
jgi:hypothetical protein